MTQQAPGCFGAASVFAHDSEVCNRCESFGACSGESLKTLESIKGIINVDDLMKRHAAAKRKANEALVKRDAERSAAMPPGNIQAAVQTAPVERKTQVLKVEFELNEDEKAVVAKLPKKASSIAISLLKGGMFDQLRNGLARGENPFTSSQRWPAYLRTAAQALIEGGFTRADLKARFMAEFDWQDTTAGPHVSLVLALLMSFKVIQVQGDKFCPLPATA